MQRLKRRDRAERGKGGMFQRSKKPSAPLIAENLTGVRTLLERGYALELDPDDVGICELRRVVDD